MIGGMAPALVAAVFGGVLHGDQWLVAGEGPARGSRPGDDDPGATASRDAPAVDDGERFLTGSTNGDARTLWRRARGSGRGVMPAAGEAARACRAALWPPRAAGRTWTQHGAPPHASARG